MGTGIPLTDPSCLDRTKWYSPGIMSKLLIVIRDKLNHDQEASSMELMEVTSRQQE